MNAGAEKGESAETGTEEGEFERYSQTADPLGDAVRLQRKPEERIMRSYPNCALVSGTMAPLCAIVLDSRAPKLYPWDIRWPESVLGAFFRT